MELDLDAAGRHERRKKQKNAAVGIVGLLVVAAAVVAALVFLRPKEDWDPGQEAEYAELGRTITGLESKCDDFLGKYGPLAGTEAESMRKCRWRLSSALGALDAYRAGRDTVARRRVLDQVGNIVADAREDFEALSTGRSE